VNLYETKISVTKELFVKLFLFFFNTYYVGIAVTARWPAAASSISSKLLLTTFDIWHKFYTNATITHATQKSLDYFIIRFLSFYHINATKIEKIVYYTRFVRRTVTLSSLRLSCPNNQLVSHQASYKTHIIINYYLLYALDQIFVWIVVTCVNLGNDCFLNHSNEKATKNFGNKCFFLDIILE
jgi:hypothetical protein